MTDEGASLIENYIPQEGVRYPMVRASNAAYGIRGYPTVYFIGPDGKVLSSDGGIPEKDVIEDALRSVTLLPDLPDGSIFSRIRKDWQKRDFADVLETVEKELACAERLEPDEKAALEKLKADLDKMQARAEKKIGELAQGPDYYKAQVQLEAITSEWKGRELEAKAEAVLDKFDEDDGIKAEIRAGAALAHLEQKYDTSRSSQKRKLVEALQKFRKRFDGTHAAERATQLVVVLSR